MRDIYGDALVQAAEQIASRDDFIEFVKALTDNLDRHPEEWQNASLETFIRGLSGFVEKMDNYYANIGVNVTCDPPSWRIFADVRLAARVYE